jgi:hypothetical protein
MPLFFIIASATHQTTLNKQIQETKDISNTKSKSSVTPLLGGDFWENQNNNNVIKK